VDWTGHGYPGLNSDEVWPVADIRDCTYMSDRGCVMIWAKSLPRAGGLLYTSMADIRDHAYMSDRGHVMMI